MGTHVRLSKSIIWLIYSDKFFFWLFLNEVSFLHPFALFPPCSQAQTRVIETSIVALWINYNFPIRPVLTFLVGGGSYTQKCDSIKKNLQSAWRWCWITSSFSQKVESLICFSTNMRCLLSGTAEQEVENNNNKFDHGKVVSLLILINGVLASTQLHIYACYCPCFHMLKNLRVTFLKID